MTTLLNLLYACGLGVAFAVGVSVGIIAGLRLFRFAVQSGLNEQRKLVLETYKRTEDRLEGYVVQATRIADALEYFERVKRQELATRHGVEVRP